MKPLTAPTTHHAPTLLPGKPIRRIRRAFDQIIEFAGHVSAALRESARRRRVWRALRAQRRTLGDLDERTLKDIGLHRSELDSLGAELGGLAERSRRQRADRSVAPLY